MIAKIADVSRATVQRTLDMYGTGGLAAVRTFHWKPPVSALTPHRPLLEAEFAARPPHTVGEACERIEKLTGVRRGPTQVREFLRNTMGLRWRKVAAVPVPPKLTLQEHTARQADFLNTKLQPRLAEAQAGQRAVFFVDAAHFVLSTFLGWMWCMARVCVKAASGRQRHNVLGAFNAVTHQFIHVSNDT